jgi:sugar phosphate isomerase/epimerase
MYFSGIADEAHEDIDRQIEAHQELGWKHIELRNINGVCVTDLCDETFDRVVQKVTDAGLGVSCFASQLCNWSRPITTHPDIDRNELKRAIPRMRRLGCKYIRMMSYPNVDWADEDWRDEVIRRVKDLATIAENGGVTLVHENCDGWAGQGPEQSLEFIEEVDSPNLKLLWDTGNPVQHGQAPWDFYSKIKEHVAYVHIKDARRDESGEITYTMCGDGDGMVDQVLEDLIDRGYDGAVSIEPHVAAVIHEGKKAADEEEAFQRYIVYGRRLVQLVDRLQ